MPAGTFIVPLAQPAGRSPATCSTPTSRWTTRSSRNQDRRRNARLPDQIYDVTAWNLPMMFDVDVVASDRATTVRGRDVGPTRKRRGP
jgi:hypothetical protein